MASAGVVPAAVPAAAGESSPAPQEIDTCRICRGEGSVDEPLFHPCKCSGSIMYVHQDCLMEWLSHSQKKHCELCKTSFTFTKLYHPNMPSTLPTAIFLRKAAGHVVSKTLYWARGALVALTWLFWLPWTMRFVWWGLFWLADMGWVHDVEFQDGGLVLTNSSRAVTNATGPGLLPDNFSSDHPPRLGLVQFFIWLFDATAHVEWEAAHTNRTVPAHANMTASLARVRSRDTLLSEVPLFAHPVLDRVATDILEGLVITISLVAVIVLVLLIREWVVQQQPIINMGVDDNAPNPMPGQDEDERDVMLDNAEDDPLPNPDTESNAAAATRGSANQRQQEPAAELNADFEIDLNLAEWEQLTSLCEDAARNSKHLRHFQRDDLGSMRNWGGDVYATQRCASLVIRFHETHLALAKAADRAEKNADRSSISQMRHKVALLQEALRFLSDFEADKLMHSIAITRFRIDDYLSSTPSEGDDGISPDAPWARIQNVLECHPESPESQPSDVVDAPQSRPSMPGRDESSLATEIQRNLQESVEQRPEASEQNPEPPAEADLGGRSNSDEGWQNIQTSDADPNAPGESGPERIPASPAEARLDASVTASRARSNSVPNSQSSGSVNFERPLPRAEFWSRRARPLPPRRRSTDHFSTTEETGSYHQSARRASSSLSGLEGRSEDVQVPEQAESAPSRAASNLEGQTPFESETQHREEDNRLPPASQSTPDQDTWFTRSLDWLYGDVAPAAENARHIHVNDEHVIDDIADEEPFVLFNAVQEGEQRQVPDPVQNEVAAANPNQAVGRPALVPNEAELIDEAEELEGVLELIGMQGPITGLFTNALFAAVFVSCTTTLAVWAPFLTGKLVIVGLAHPITLGDVLFRAGSGCVNLFVDFCIFTVVYALQWLLNIPLNWVSAWKGFENNPYETPFFGPLSSWSLDLLNRTYGRLASEFSSVVRSTGAASSHLTLDSHTALSHVKGHAHSVINNIASATVSLRQQLSSEDAKLYLSTDTLVTAAKQGFANLIVVGTESLEAVKRLPQFLWAGQVTLQHSSGLSNLEPDTDSLVWSALDRSLTVTVGYIALGICAGIYFTRIAPIATTREGRKMENMVLEVLQQTGGVSKVILIISIEMLAFPLYCGLLLDIATLPLFGFSSIDSRLSFTLGSPWTSAFVHWFIGTCYMFHFALFVAMCRKILRKGVLYFIRDPDDPTFHPVRDVLERSVASQLRKIMSSAMIYGGLVIVCLGSVLWLLAFGISGILPIKWTSESFFLGFPVDLVIYTTIKPALVRFLAPADWVHQVYEWWFKKSARVLRLSHYLFGYDNQDERGQGQDPSGNGTATTRGSMSGRWVRVPNNDQVRVGKGKKAWTEVDEDNHRQDGQAEPHNVAGVGPNDPNFTKVYVPPYFRLRIALFFASLWALTAGSGFALTVLPLLCGRSLFAILLPKPLWANDIYAFSIGLFALGAVVVAAIRVDVTRVRPLLSPAPFWYATKTASRQFWTVIFERCRRVLRCVYVYGSVAIIMPCLFSLLGEFYILGPLHTWFSDGKVAHTVHLLRSWTLGVQYLRVVVSIIQWSTESTAARAFRAVTARGYFDPDAGKATRYFFLPITIASALALIVPIPIGLIAAWAGAPPDDEAKRRLISSLTFPAILAAGVIVLLSRATLALLRGWRMHIRDEVYLIGERLHNYGERVVPKMKTKMA